MPVFSQAFSFKRHFRSKGIFVQKAFSSFDSAPQPVPSHTAPCAIPHHTPPSQAVANSRMAAWRYYQYQDTINSRMAAWRQYNTRILSIAGWRGQGCSRVHRVVGVVEHGVWQRVQLDAVDVICLVGLHSYGRSMLFALLAYTVMADRCYLRC